MNTDNIIGIIGYGNMGSAIGERLKSQYKVLVFDKDSHKTKHFIGIDVADNIVDLVDKVDTIILAVKPQDFEVVLDEIKNYVRDKLIVSIAAGIETRYIEERLGKVRVIRAMPNIGVKIGESLTCLCKGNFVISGDLKLARELFNCLGVIKEIDEKMMNSSTAISGSGPAYIFDYIELNSIDPNNISEDIKESIVKRLAKAAKGVDFNTNDAMFLAVNISNTSIDLIKKTGLQPSELKRQITSRGGTTEAALEVLHNGGSWEDAAKAAVKRAEELSQKE